MIHAGDLANLTLLPWQNFYILVGSSAGALIGLQFVVITLIADGRHRTTLETVNAFGTPTVVHFGGALTISAIMVAPWPTLADVAAALALYGLGGLVYSAVVVRRAVHQKDYKPDGEDWFWYVFLPFVVYAALAWAGLRLDSHTPWPMFVGAGATLSLLLIGIRNAWDTVRHLVSSRAVERESSRAVEPGRSGPE